jgi:hypothetical protein
MHQWSEMKFQSMLIVILTFIIYALTKLKKEVSMYARVNDEFHAPMDWEVSTNADNAVVWLFLTELKNLQNHVLSPSHIIISFGKLF